MYFYIFTLILQSIAQQYTVSKFQGKAFQFTNLESGIYQVDVGLNSTFNGTMACYGDFNGDKAQVSYNIFSSVDVVVMGAERNQVYILYWINNEFVEDSVCQGQKCFPEDLVNNYQLYGINPLDFNYDGLLDMLLIFSDGTSEQYNLMILLQISNPNSDYPQFTQFRMTYSQSLSYPFLADFMGDHRTSIMITTANGDAIVRQIVYYKNETQQADILDFTSLTDTQNGCIGGVQYEAAVSAQFLDIHFNSFVDVNKDCRADLILTSTIGIEYWYTNYMGEENEPSKARFCLLQIVPFNSVTLNTMSFTDINFDGTTDLIAVVTPINSQDQWLLVNYNQQPNPGDSDICQMAVPYSQQNRTYPYESSLTLTNTSYSISTPLLDENKLQLYVYNQAANNLTNTLGPYLRFGDYLATGFPGALTILCNNTNQELPTVYYIMNYQCGNCPELVVSNPRYLGVGVPSYFNEILSQQAVNAAFFDYGENGRLDFLINSWNSKTNDFNILAYYNYISLDAFYLKALGIDGQCAASDESYIPCLGALYYGSTYQFNVTTIEGVYRPAVGVQLYQSAFTALQLPYAYVGLGRTNNYIQDFYLGMPLANGAIKSWTPIIPNSQLIASPYTANTNSWTLSIFIEPTEAILVVVIVTVIILIVLGAVIIWQHIKEKEEDKQNQEQFNQMFR